MNKELFEKNIRFFYKNLPHFYELIKNIKERNFVLKEHNIYDKNGNKIYPNNIHYDSFSLVNNFEPHVLYSTFDSWWSEEEFFITGRIINKLIQYADSYGFSLRLDSNIYPTTVLFGLLGGKHLEILVRYFDFHSLFVYEPNPEFFAISLYFVDYEYIYEKLQNRFFLWVNGKVEYEAIEKFYYERTITSSLVNFYYTAYNHPLIEDAKAKFQQVKASALRGWGTYEDEIKGVKNHLKNITKYPLLSSAENINTPVCIIANGKSLEKNLDFIKKNKDSMILISVGTALKPLMKAGIESDFHIEQERIPTLIEALKDVLPDYNGYFVGASVVREEVFEMAKKTLMYAREGFSFSYFYPQLIGSSPIVGNAGFAFGASFSNEIYLCGMDLGFRLNEKKHAQGSFYDSLKDTSKNGIKIEGNFSDDIYTDSLFLTSKRNIERVIKFKNLKVYNLSDGVKIKGSIPLKDKNLPKIDKKKIIEKIVSHFTFTQRKEKNLNLNPIIKAFSKSLNIKRLKNKKELIGRIDFIEDSLKTLEEKNPPIAALLKGSFYHILFNIYGLAHKNSLENIDKAIKKIKRDLFLFEKDFNKIIKS